MMLSNNAVETNYQELNDYRDRPLLADLRPLSIIILNERYSIQSSRTVCYYLCSKYSEATPSSTKNLIASWRNDCRQISLEPSGFDHPPGESSSSVTRCPPNIQTAKTNAGIVAVEPQACAPIRKATIDNTTDATKVVRTMRLKSCSKVILLSDCYWPRLCKNAKSMRC